MAKARSPFITPDNHEWAEAAKEHRLLVRHCTSCGRNHYYPRPHCPFCHSLDTHYIEASGKGVIYTFTVNRVSSPPLVNAYVTLAEGPTIMTKIVHADSAGLTIGQTVELAFEESRMGFPVPVFTLARS